MLEFCIYYKNENIRKKNIRVIVKKFILVIEIVYRFFFFINYKVWYGRERFKLLVGNLGF